MLSFFVFLIVFFCFVSYLRFASRRYGDALVAQLRKIRLDDLEEKRVVERVVAAKAGACGCDWLAGRAWHRLCLSL